MIDRRAISPTLGGGFGLAALQGTLQAETRTRPHFAPKAKHVIFLFLNGGMSQVDTFDPKPALTKYDGQPMPGPKIRTDRASGTLMRRPWEFKKLRPVRARSQRDLSAHCGANRRFLRDPLDVHRQRQSRAVAAGDELRPPVAGPAVAGRVGHVWARHGESESSRLHRSVPRLPRARFVALERRLHADRSIRASIFRTKRSNRKS